MWKKLVVSLVIVGSFSGCVTDKLYNAGKTVYVKGKAVVIENYDMLDDNTKARLEALDEMATTYDENRSRIIEGKDAK